MSEKKPGLVKRIGVVADNGMVQWAQDKVEKITDGFNIDGWKNVLTGLGIANRDKRLNSQFQRGNRLSQQRELLEELFHGDDIARRYCQLPAKEATREWITLTIQNSDEETDQDLSSDVMDELEVLEAQAKFMEAKTWGRLYGGALLLMGVDDGQEPDQELNLDNLRSFD